MYQYEQVQTIRHLILLNKDLMFESLWIESIHVARVLPLIDSIWIGLIKSSYDFLIVVMQIKKLSLF